MESERPMNECTGTFRVTADRPIPRTSTLELGGGWGQGPLDPIPLFRTDRYRGGPGQRQQNVIDHIGGESGLPEPDRFERSVKDLLESNTVDVRRHGKLVERGESGGQIHYVNCALDNNRRSASSQKYQRHLGIVGVRSTVGCAG